MTACAREGCGHDERAHGGVYGTTNRCIGNRNLCSCPAYQPAPTPTTGLFASQGETIQLRSGDATPSLGERDDFCVICGKQGTHTEWCARRDAAPEERARTAEPEVERLRAELAAAGLAVQADARATLAARAAHDAEHARALRAEEAEAVLRRQVDAVRALHIANRFGECQHCIVGEEYDGSLLYQPYPCDTISALDGA